MKMCVAIKESDLDGIYCATYFFMRTHEENMDISEAAYRKYIRTRELGTSLRHWHTEYKPFKAKYEKFRR